MNEPIGQGGGMAAMPPQGGPAGLQGLTGRTRKEGTTCR
jgi:hypothetical protein